MLCNCLRSIEILLLLSVHFATSGPLRIASNGVDSVVLGGNEKTLIIDTSTSFRVMNHSRCAYVLLSVERLDAPIERIEIRLIDENTTQPVLIDIQKPTQSPSSAEASSNSVIEPDSGGENDEQGTHLHHHHHHHHHEAKERKQTTIGFEVKLERKVEHIVPNSGTDVKNRWSNSDSVGQSERVNHGNNEYVDDLPPLDIGDDT
ncbi:unnamed protein product, partial [Anisakis simplex]|uniref:Cadherin domain-containing protein n=1 Tax=Anisakis simplex TaxID=6269 RepID=A0A0M3JAI5_ANISI